MYCPMSGLGSARPVAAVIAAYSPCSLSAEAAAFARAVCARADPQTAQRAKALLFAAGRLGAFGDSVGLELSAEALLCEAVIERFVLVGLAGVSPATRRTLRSNLRALSRACERYPKPAPVALVRDRAKAPYSEAEIEGYLRLAGAQSTRARRMRCTALVCLGAGAGVIASELRRLRGTDIICRTDGVLVAVSGARARKVPVLERYQQPLVDAARFAGQRYIIGGRNPERSNVTDALTAVLSADRSLPRLKAGRLRSTWLVWCAERIGLGAFMQAAGVRCSQQLGDLAQRLPGATDTELLALFAGTGT